MHAQFLLQFASVVVPETAVTDVAAESSAKTPAPHDAGVGGVSRPGQFILRQVEAAGTNLIQAVRLLAHTRENAA